MFQRIKNTKKYLEDNVIHDIDRLVENGLKDEEVAKELGVSEKELRDIKDQLYDE